MCGGAVIVIELLLDCHWIAMGLFLSFMVSPTNTGTGEAPKDYTKPQKTIPSPDRLYKAPETLHKHINIRQKPKNIRQVPKILNKSSNNQFLT